MGTLLASYPPEPQRSQAHKNQNTIASRFSSQGRASTIFLSLDIPTLTSKNTFNQKFSCIAVTSQGPMPFPSTPISLYHSSLWTSVPHA
jgi:hypothetical protein